jgi:hypothetical protein
LAAILALGERKLQSAPGVHQALARIFTLLAEDRISARRAAVLAYVGSLLLRTLAHMDSNTAQKAAFLRKMYPHADWSMLAAAARETIPGPADVAS